MGMRERFSPRSHGKAPDYGIDAPGVRRGMVLVGAVGGAVAVVAIAVATQLSGTASTIAGVIAVLAAPAAIYGLGMAAYMTYGSRVGKLRTRECLLDLCQGLRPWTGDEAVLDVGCGRGLMLVAAARRLTTGRAVGIDLWRDEDQAGNAPAATLENARREGVSDRVSVETGDARVLPFADASFDAVLSHWVVHNLTEAEDRTRALAEMLRVLRPGGVLVLADIANHADYRTQLKAGGLTDFLEQTGGLEAKIIGLLSGGTFCPQAIIGRKT